MLACGTPSDAVDGYRQAKQAAARTVLEAKTRVWEEFGTLSDRWKKYFEDLLNPTTDLPSSEEAEAGDSEVDSSITRAEVTEVVRKLLGGKARRNNAVFVPVVVEHWTSSILSCRVLEGLWEFAQPVHMCFVDLEKAFDRVPRGILLWGVLREYGVRGPLLRAVRSLYDRSRSLVLHCRYQGPEGVRFGNHRISSLLFADDVVLLASSSQDLQRVLERFAAECEAAGMRISTSKSEAMVLDRKRVACPLRVGGEVLPQVEEFKYLGVLFTSEGKMEREIDRRIGAASAVMRSVYRTVVVKKELSRRRSSRFTGQSTFPPSPMRSGEKLSHFREELGVEPLLLHIERSQLRWLGHLFRMPPGRLPREVFQACPTGRRPRGRPRTRWRDYVSQLAWEHPGPPGRAGGSVWGEGSLGISAQTAASMTRPRIKRMKMDGWMDGWMD
ncbi:hypothetical protein L3Q82_010853, partial [Scortum barcoo]